MHTATRVRLLARTLVAGSGVMALANSITIPFLAFYLKGELGLDPATIGLLIGSSVGFSILAGFTGGALSDLFGRVPVLLAGLAGVVVSFTGFFLAEHVLVVFACNGALALSAAVFGPVGKALLSDLIAVEERAAWFSHQYIATNVGYTVGPLAGVLLGLAGGRSAFLAAAVAYAAYLGLLAVAVRGVRPAAAAPEPAERPGVAARLLDSLRAVATDRRLLCLLVAGLLIEAVQLRISALLAQDLDRGFPDGAAVLAAVMTANAVTVVAFQVLAARLTRRLEPVTAIVVGALLLFAGMAGFAFSGEAWHFVAAMVVFSIGETFIVPSEFAVVDRIAPEDRRGGYFGAQTFTQLGGFIGPYLGGLLLTAWNGTVMFLGVGSLALVSVIVYLAVGRAAGLTRRAGRTGSASD